MKNWLEKPGYMGHRCVHLGRYSSNSKWLFHKVPLLNDWKQIQCCVRCCIGSWQQFHLVNRKFLHRGSQTDTALLVHAINDRVDDGV